MKDREKLEIIINKCLPESPNILFNPPGSVDDALVLLQALKETHGTTHVVHIEPDRSSCYIWENNRATAPTWVAFDADPARAIFQAVYEACA